MGDVGLNVKIRIPPAEGKENLSGTADGVKGIGAAAKQASEDAQTSAQKIDTAYRTLGIRSLADIRTEIGNVAGAYKTLAASGSASGEELARASAAAKIKLDALHAEIKNTAATSATTGSRLASMLNVKSSGQLQAELTAIQKALKNLQTDSGAPAAEVNRMSTLATQRIAALKAEMAGVKPPADDAASSVGALGKQLLQIGGTVAGLAAIKEGLAKVVEQTMAYERTQKQMEYALGSSEKARQEFEFVKQVCKDLALDLNATSSSFAKLAASTKGTRLEGEPTRELFKGIAQAAAALGLSVDDTNGVIMALSQMASKGKVSMEELRGQLGERLPGAMQIAAKSMGVTTAEMEKLVENGMDANVFLSRFGPAMQQAFGPDAAKNAQTLQGQINLLKNEFNGLLTDLGQGGIAQGAVTVFKQLREGIEGMREGLADIDDATLEAMKQTLDGLLDTVGTLLNTILESVGEVSDVLDTLTNGVSGLINGFDGLENSAEQVSFVTRCLQGVAVTIGFISDGIKMVGIGFQTASGIAQSFFAAVSLGLSKVTFGDLSKDLETFAMRMTTSAQESFAAANKSALEFKSSAVKVLDDIATGSEKSAERQKAAQVGASSESSKALLQMEANAKKATDAMKALAQRTADIAEASLKVGKSHLDTVKADVDVGRARLGVWEAQNKYSKEGGALAAAELQYAQLNLKAAQARADAARANYAEEQAAMKVVIALQEYKIALKRQEQAVGEEAQAAADQLVQQTKKEQEHRENIYNLAKANSAEKEKTALATEEELIKQKLVVEQVKAVTEYQKTFTSDVRESSGHLSDSAGHANRVSDGMKSASVSAGALIGNLQVMNSEQAKMVMEVSKWAAALDGVADAQRRLDRLTGQGTGVHTIDSGSEERNKNVKSITGKNGQSTAAYNLNAVQLLQQRFEQAQKTGDYSGFSADDLALARTWLQSAQTNKQIADQHSNAYSIGGLSSASGAVKEAQRVVDMLSGYGLANGNSGLGGFAGAGGGSGGFAAMSQQALSKVASAASPVVSQQAVQAAASSTPSKTTTVNFQLGGKTVSANINAADEKTLLDMLEQIKKASA